MSCRTRFAALCLASLVACASHEGPAPTGSKPTAPEAKAIEFRGMISSVSLIQNCPDPPADPAAPAAGPADESRAAAMPPSPGSAVAPGAALRQAGDSPNGWSQPCTQSTMQLSVSHDGKAATAMEIKAVRLTAAGTGAQLGAVPFRAPTQWNDDGRYVTWNQEIPAARELKVAYRLGEPDWDAVGKALGSADTYAPRYVLEVDVGFAGRTITLRSPEFQREYPHVVVT
ncbi:MAG: hypothetical protein U0168_00725 [Nannocystaceae bacterium]